MRLRLCYENLNDCALQEPNVVDALAHQLFSRRIFIKCFHKDKILETWHENWAETTGFQGITNAFPSQALLTWEQKNHERGNDTFITRKKPNFHIPFPTTFRKLSLTLKGLPESRPCGYYQVTSTNMKLCHAKCLFTNFIRSETPKHFWKNESFKSLCRNERERGTLANQGWAKSFERLHYESTPFFRACWRTTSSSLFPFPPPHQLTCLFFQERPILATTVS